MRITRVRIENFRSIEAVEFSPLPLCALIGANNAGKSNILRALRMTLERDWLTVNTFDDADFFRLDQHRDILIEAEFDPPLVYKPFVQGRETPVPVLRYRVTRYKRATERAKAGERRLESHCLDFSGQPVMALAKAPKKGEQQQFRPLTPIPAEVREQVPIIYVGTDRSLGDQLPYARASLLRRLFEDVEAALEQRTTTVTREDGTKEVLTSAQLFRERLSLALEALRVPEFIALEQLIRENALRNLGLDPVADLDRLRFEFDLFGPLDFYKTLRLAFSERGMLINAVNMGEGAQNALIMAIVQAYEALKKAGAIFLIEEPEMYLHPHQRRFFYRALREIASENQVFYTTHSAEFVSVPEFEEIALVYRDGGDTTKVRRSTLTPTGTLKERLRKELDPTRNELFFSKHVVLVEGDTERLALPEYARRLGVDLDAAGWAIIEVGGKRGLLPFYELVSSFGLPVSVVFDRDSSDFDKSKKAQEEEFNNKLRQLSSKGVEVVELDPRYEAALRSEIGEGLYDTLSNSFPGPSKVSRQRLIAADERGPIPSFAYQLFAPLLP